MINNKVIIIAEAGVNHNGDINLAYQLIDAAKSAGADYVKFQTFIPSLLVSKDAVKAEYQNKKDTSTTQKDMLEKLALNYEHFRELAQYCKKQGIGFLSTGFDEQSVLFIDSLNVDFHKVPSGEITNLPYLELISGLKKKIILSTGMADLQEIEDAVNVLYSKGVVADDLTILQCTTEYPAPYDEVNLFTIKTLRERFGVSTGLSDHTQGIEVSIAAVALGARMVEKHFTLSKEMTGPDHAASLEPTELSELVKAIRNVEKALGSGYKAPSPSEIKNKAAARKSIHIKHDLTKGHVLQSTDLIMKRPGTGISPMLLNDIIGKRLLVDIKEDTILKPEHFTDK